MAAVIRTYGDGFNMESNQGGFFGLYSFAGSQWTDYSTNSFSWKSGTYQVNITGNNFFFGSHGYFQGTITGIVIKDSSNQIVMTATGLAWSLGAIDGWDNYNQYYGFWWDATIPAIPGIKVVGTAGNDRLIGGGNSQVLGLAGNDYIDPSHYAGAGPFSALVDGGPGNDTAAFDFSVLSKPAPDLELIGQPSGAIVLNFQLGYEKVTMTNVELLQFSDYSMNLTKLFSANPDYVNFNTMPLFAAKYYRQSGFNLYDSGDGMDSVVLPDKTQAQNLGWDFTKTFRLGAGSDYVVISKADPANALGNNVIDGGKDNDTLGYSEGALDWKNAVSSFGIAWQPDNDGQYIITRPDGGFDRVHDVEQIVSLAAFNQLPLKLAPHVYTIQVHRNANGSGSIEAFEDGVSMGAPVSSKNKLNPKQMYDPSHVFAWDDLTPIKSGTYNAFIRTDAAEKLTKQSGVDITLFNIAGTPERTDVAVHVGNGTYNSEGCFVLGSANLYAFLTPMMLAYQEAGIVAISTSELTKLGSVNLASQPNEMMLPGILPTANADKDGNPKAGPFEWNSSVQVEVYDDQAITQPKLSFGTARRIALRNNQDVLQVEINLSHAVSKDLELSLSVVGSAGTLASDVMIAGGTTKSVAIVRLPKGWSSFKLHIDSIFPGDRQYEQPGKLYTLLTQNGGSSGVYKPASLAAATGVVSIDTGYGGKSWVVTDFSKVGLATPTSHFDSITLVESAAATASAAIATPAAAPPVPAQFVLPDGIEAVVAQGLQAWTLVGGTGTDFLTGGAGDDVLVGGDGADVLLGGDGVDAADYSASAVGLKVDLAAPDNNTGVAAGDTLGGIENLIGSNLDDALYGDDGANQLIGLKGRDLLQGRAGKDVLDGGAGVDTADYSDKSTDVIATLNGATDSTVTVSGVAEDTIRSIENVTGGSGDDTLTGDSSSNALMGGAGDDLLRGGPGKDLLDGGAGNDTADYSEKSVTVSLRLLASSNASAIVGDVAEDTVRNVENILGGSTADSLTGDEMANVVVGGGGDDTLRGSSGDDLLRGGLGKDILDGGIDVDTADYSDKTVAVSLVLNGSTSSTVKVEGVVEDTIRNIENVTGGSEGDTLTGDDLANRLAGSAGNDTLKGAGGDDVLSGGAGKDLLDGGAGMDTADYSEKTVAISVTLNGAANTHVTVNGLVEDTIRNSENVSGGSGNDTLTGDGLANVLAGGAGDDLLKGQDGNDVLRTGIGVDSLDGGGGIDTADYSDMAVGFGLTLNGSTMASVYTGFGLVSGTVVNIENVIGGSEGDYLRGDALANELTGGLGSDSLFGGDGDDLLIGGAGSDQLTGGAGSDRFVLNATADVDRIWDFTVGSDTIVLDKTVFAAAGATGLLASSAFYVGSSSHASSDRIIYDQATGNLFYDSDGSAGATAVQIAILTPGLSLGSEDLMIA